MSDALASMARRSYREAFDARGERVEIRRGTGQSLVSVSVRARVIDFAPDELVGDITQNHRRILILAEDATLSPPIQPTDRIVVRGKPMTVETVDDNTRRIGSTLLAYQVRAKGI